MNNEDRAQRLLALDEKRLVAAEKAMDQLIKGLDDPKTPPTARSNLIVTALRSNGMMDPKSDPDKALEPHEMTAEQLQQNIARLRREASDRSVLVIDAVGKHVLPVRTGPVNNSVFD